MPHAPMPQKVGDYYTLTGAALALGVSYWTVYRYVRLSGIPVTRLGHLTLVKLEDLRALGVPQAPASRSGELFDW